MKSQSASFARLKMDIRHLDLSSIDGIPDMDVVSYGKHICGSATCLSMASLKSLALNPLSRASVYMVIATCCHQLCTWQTYFGRAVLEACGFTAETFLGICKATSWYLCGSMRDQRCSVLLTLTRKVQCGELCKRIIDLARAVQLKNSGFTVQYFPYISGKITPENYVLVAWRHCAAHESRRPAT